MNEYAKEDAIRHALAAYPIESVGYIKGDKYTRLINLCDDPTHFEISTEQELEVYKVGVDYFMHSHPDGHRCPSASDMAHQEKSGVPWAIVVLTPPDKIRPVPQYLEVFEFGAEMPIVEYEGRDFRHGVQDCYSLVRDWWRQEKNVRLPYFPRDDEWWKDGQDLIMECLGDSGFRRIEGDDLRRGDVVLMSVGHHFGQHMINHLAVYLGDGTVLHHFAGRLSRRDPIHLFKQHHIVGYTRHGGKS